jgi:hypothetical protein
VEDRCGEVPSSPGNPPGDNVEDVTEADDTAEDIGDPTCNTIPDQIIETEENGQPGIRVIVRAASGNATYPSNSYIVFAKRYKVSWDHVDADGQRPRTYKVDFQTLHVHDDTDDVSDGEWVLSLRVNEKWIHPVRGHGDDDDPFWENGAVGSDESYSIGDSLTVSPMMGQPVRVWLRGWDDDTTFIQDNDVNEVLPKLNSYHYSDTLPPPGGSTSYTEAGSGGVGAYDLDYTITDISDPQPPTCCISFGAPQFGPGPETNGLLRVNGTDAHKTPIVVEHSVVDGLEWRFWRVADPVFPGWSFDFDGADGLRLNLPNFESASGTYNVQWATIRTTDGRRVVSPRERFQVELDNTPPTLVVPADFSVFATETAGAHVEYTVEVSDNFPGPVTYECNPPSGALFPNGKNAPRTTTVTCVATDAVDNEATETFDVTVISPFGYLKDFVVLGIDWARLGGNVEVASGNVGAFDASTGVPTAPGFEVVIGSSANLGAGPQIAAESDKLGNNSTCGDVFFVTPISAGNGAVFNPRLGYVPLFLGLPLAPPDGGGGPNLSLSGTQLLPPGSYGTLTVKPPADITFTGGAYSFTEVAVQPGAAISFAAPTLVVVSGRVDLGNTSRLGPSVASGTSPRDIVVYVNGADGAGSHDALAIGGHAEVRLDAFVPNGTLSIGAFTEATGAFVGRRVDVASDVVLNLDSSFLVP